MSIFVFVFLRRGVAAQQRHTARGYTERERDGRTWWGDDLAQTYSPGFGVDNLLHVPPEALELLLRGPEHWACSFSHAAAATFLVFFTFFRLCAAPDLCRFLPLSLTHTPLIPRNLTARAGEAGREKADGHNLRVAGVLSVSSLSPSFVGRSNFAPHF